MDAVYVSIIGIFFILCLIYIDLLARKTEKF